MLVWFLYHVGFGFFSLKNNERSDILYNKHGLDEQGHNYFFQKAAGVTDMLLFFYIRGFEITHIWRLIAFNDKIMSLSDKSDLVL